jgi:site-specific DNA recombinase
MLTRKCALYGRVSTVRQALIQDGGLDTQFDLMERFVQFETAKGEAAWTVVGRYREEACSGKNLERPEFRRLMRDIEAGTVDTVIVQKIDRITRSLKDFFILWEHFETHGVQFISLHEKFDTTSAVGRAMLKLILVFAELEREQTAERTLATMEHRARQGLRNGGRILGYNLDPNEKGVLKVNEVEARVARDHFFSKFLELGSAGKVVRHLKAQGIREPAYTSRRGQQRGGGNFTKPKVIRLLSNPAYVGKIGWKGSTFPARHPAIISQELFDEVQRLLERNREKKGNGREQRAHVFLLQGLIRCGRCGAFMTPKTSIGRGGKPHFYYQCTRNAHSAATECSARYVPAVAAEEHVLAELRKWSMSAEEIDRVVQQANAQQDEQLARSEQELGELQRRLMQVKERTAPLLTALESGAAFASIKERLAALEGERTTLEQELARTQHQTEQMRQRVLSTEILAGSYRDFPAMLDQLRQAEDWKAIKELVSRYVEVLDWHQDEQDPTAGHVDIMLFEQALPSGEKAEHLDAPLVVSAGAPRCNKRLPDQDSNLEQTG